MLAMTRMGAPIRLPAPWDALANAVGGVDVLATCLGVHERTIRRWATGEVTPGKLVREAVCNFAAARGVKTDPWGTQTLHSKPRNARRNTRK